MVQPLVGRNSIDEHSEISLPARSVMCIPVEVEGKTQGVLYYDNSYLDDAFDFSDPAILKQMVRHTNLIIERRFHYLRIKEERNFLASEKSLLLEKSRGEVVHRSRIMTALLKKADHIAATEINRPYSRGNGNGKGTARQKNLGRA